MADRVISVRLRMEVDQARRGSKAAADDLRRVGQAATFAGRAGTAGLTAIGNAAASAGKAVAMVGTVSAGGMTALTVSVLKTGVAYNTLEQTSRAALTTLLGSASAASDQMEKLKEFGKTSPFPRQVWITAQQQLLAFGLEAEKVIPTLQAIQDAVAAAGGNSQTIAEIVPILARIKSTGKVTAEELNELGYRGIDAAKLVGDAMGKSAAEVRKDITSQAISGQQFLDTLTTAMEQHFAGAAANVKQTWVGAKDRVKGALRDIGSELASPLVNPTGGGAAVEWANSVADALRALETRLKPVIAALAERAGPIFDAISAKLQHLAEWIKTADFSAIGQKIQAMLPAIAGLTAGFTTLGAKSIPIIGGMVEGLKPLPIALFAAAMASPELRQALIDLLVAAQPLIQATGDMASILANALGPALQVVAALLQPVIAVVQVLGNVLGALPGPVQAIIAGFIAWKALGLGAWVMENVTALRRFSEEMAVQKSLAAMGGQEIGTMGAAYSVAATKVSGAAIGIKGALSSVAEFLTGPWGIAIGLGITLLGAFSSSTDNANADQQGLADTLDKTTGAITNQTRAWVLNKLETDGVAEIYRRTGGDINDLVDAYLGVPGAAERVAGAIKEGGAAAHLTGDDLRTLWGALEGAQSRMKNAKDAARDKAKVDGDAANAANNYANAENNAANASSNAAGAAAGLASGLTQVGSASDDAATRAQQLSALLSGIFDAKFGLQKAQDDFQGGLLKLKDAFAGNEKAAGKSSAAGDKYGDALKRQQKIIRDTKKQLDDLAEAQRKAEEEAAEAAKNARQRALDEMFGKQFDTQSTMDAFQSALAQAGKDIAEGRGKPGGTSLLGFSEGSLANRDRMRGLVQSAQAAINAQRAGGASQAQIAATTEDLASQLAQSAAGWGLNADEVKQYTDAIRSFGNLALQPIQVDLTEVRKDYAEQRAEIEENSREQMDNAKAAAASASAAYGAAGAADYHTNALKGNSKSAIENREMFRQQVKAAQDELTQMHLNGAGKEELTRRGEELSGQLQATGIQLGFTTEDMDEYTGAIKESAREISLYPTLNARADVSGAMVTIQNFVKGVNDQMAKIQHSVDIGVRTGSEYINSISGGHMYFADGGFVTGPGGPRDDKIPAMLSNREFVVNARDTAKNRTLLDLINTGREIDWMPKYAGGGYVDPINLRYSATYDPKQIEDTFTQFGNTFGMTFAPYDPAMFKGSGVARWAPVAAEVLAMLHQPPGLLPHVLRRMNQESGGNPTVVNRWDSNWKRGTPSVGLMQVIGPTFKRWAGPFVDTGPQLYGVSVDPRANIFAGLNYADHRYPSLQYAMDKPGGYRDGGLVLGSYARGTDYVPMDGLYKLHRGEAVTPAAQNAGGAPILLEVRSDGSKFSDLVVESINKADSTGRIRVVRR